MELCSLGRYAWIWMECSVPCVIKFFECGIALEVAASRCVLRVVHACRLRHELRCP